MVDWSCVAKTLLLNAVCLCSCWELDRAEGVLQRADASCRGLMSPLLRSRQLLLWAQLHYGRACCALNAAQPAVQNCVKALAACERARALEPLCWRKVNSWSPAPPCPSPHDTAPRPTFKPLPLQFPRQLSEFLAQLVKISGCLQLVQRSNIAAAEHVSFAQQVLVCIHAPCVLAALKLGLVPHKTGCVRACRQCQCRRTCWACWGQEGRCMSCTAPFRQSLTSLIRWKWWITLRCNRQQTSFRPCATSPTHSASPP